MKCTGLVDVLVDMIGVDLGLVRFYSCFCYRFLVFLSEQRINGLRGPLMT